MAMRVISVPFYPLVVATMISVSRRATHATRLRTWLCRRGPFFHSCNCTVYFASRVLPELCVTCELSYRRKRSVTLFSPFISLFTGKQAYLLISKIYNRNQIYNLSIFCIYLISQSITQFNRQYIYNISENILI